jgi:hypothetical protein
MFKMHGERTWEGGNNVPTVDEAAGGRQMRIEGSEFYYKFYSDGSNTQWGYKFTVTAHFEVIVSVCLCLCICDSACL